VNPSNIARTFAHESPPSRSGGYHERPRASSGSQQAIGVGGCDAPVSLDDLLAMALRRASVPREERDPQVVRRQDVALSNPARIGGRERQILRPAYTRGPRRSGFKTWQCAASAWRLGLGPRVGVHRGTAASGRHSPCSGIARGAHGLDGCCTSATETSVLLVCNQLPPLTPTRAAASDEHRKAPEVRTEFSSP